MTDREKLLALLREWKIQPVLENTTVTLEAQFGNVLGYSGFAADFQFDESGKFESVGVWELWAGLSR